MKNKGLISMSMLVCAGFFIATQVLAEAPAEAIDPAAERIKQASEAGKYALVIFHRDNEGLAEARKNMEGVADEGRAEIIDVNVSDAAVAPTVQAYGIGRATLPMILVIAPNGAVTGGFSGSGDPKLVAGAVVGKSFASCLKALQDGKLVFVAVPGTNAVLNEEAMKSIVAMTTDDRFNGYTETLTLSPTDPAGSELLAKLNVQASDSDPLTVMLVPPGRVVGTYTGVITKEQMVSDLMRAMAGSTCGSGGGGCGPRSGGCGR